MRLLLDTHIWIWAELEPARLPQAMACALMDPKNELWLSPISTWELWLLVERGRVALGRDFVSWVESCLAANQYRIADLTVGATMSAGAVHLPHRDPADRLLAATARHYDLFLVTVDEQLQAGSGFPLLVG